MSLSITYVSHIGNRGPKSTRVNFDLINGVRTWAWIPNEALFNVAVGSTVSAEIVRKFGKVETSWTDKDGTTFEKRVPTQQLLLGGKVVFDAPDPDSAPGKIPAAEFITTDQGAAYAEAARAKANDADLGADPF